MSDKIIMGNGESTPTPNAGQVAEPNSKSGCPIPHGNSSNKPSSTASSSTSSCPVSHKSKGDGDGNKGSDMCPMKAKKVEPYKNPDVYNVRV